MKEMYWMYAKPGMGPDFRKLELMAKTLKGTNGRSHAV